MKIPRGLLLLFLVGLAWAQEEEAPLPTAGLGVGIGKAEDELASTLAETGQAGDAAAAAAAAAAEEAAGAPEEKEGGVEDTPHEPAASSEGDEDAADADPTATAEAGAGEGAEGEAQETGTEIEGEKEPPAAETAEAAAAARTQGGESEGELESGTWRRRAAGRLDGFIDGWRRGKGEGDPFKGALGSYDELLEEHYLKMSFAQATALGVVGDSLAQRLERRWNPGQRYELKRTVHAGILNMIIDGIFTPHWYNLVDYVNDEMSLAIAFVKALAASVFYGPFANGLFLAGARTLRYGLKARFDWAEWRRQLTICTIRDFEMWPPLHILNFWLVPKHWRPVAGHLAGVVLLAVISSTALADANLPLGQRAMPLMMRWARAIGERLGGKGRRASGAPPAGTGQSA